MLRQDREIADSLVVMAVCIGLPVVAMSYAHNHPDPVAHTARALDEVPARMEPETTGAIRPKAEGASAHSEASLPERKAGGAVWADPPRHSKAGDRSASAIDETMELRLPRP